MGVGSIQKLLSVNDVGGNGSHQAGILVPKDLNILNYFPSLDLNQENPRALLHVVDEDGEHWKWPYIYYNNKLRGGTRNEYRLTGMTAFFRKYGLASGDTIEFVLKGCWYFVSTKKKQMILGEEPGEYTTKPEKHKLVLGNGWKVINI